MGCNASSDKSAQVPKDRRRLSVGQVENPETNSSGAEAVESDRGTIQALSAENLLNFVTEVEGGRKFSIGSQTDAGKTSFANKDIKHEGKDKNDANIGLGFTCRKGLKPESPNQDSWMVLTVESDFSIYGVFDGHGSKGHDVSEFVKNNLPKLMIKDSRFESGRLRDEDMKALCIENFKRVQSLIATCDQMKKMEAKLAGTTCTVCLHDHKNQKMHVAHVADSTAVLGKFKEGSKDVKDLEGDTLTRDHKPDLKDERARIEKAGGRVVFDGYANHRVYAKNARYPGLNMSRCLGDLMAHSDCGVSCEPEVKTVNLTENDYVLLLCSDGVWEFIEPGEAVKFVSQYPPAQAQTAADRLAKEAWDRWIKEEGGAVVDDITVVIVYLQAYAQNNARDNAP